MTTHPIKEKPVDLSEGCFACGGRGGRHYWEESGYTGEMVQKWEPCTHCRGGVVQSVAVRS